MIRNVRPIKVYNPARVLRAPPVERIHSMQPVDLNPRGATVAVDVDGQNPFESMDGIEIVTQASGGMAAADPSQQSMSVMSQEVAPVTYSMLPGLGPTDDSIMTGGVTALATESNATGTPIQTPAWKKILEAGTDIYGDRMETDRMDAEARIEGAKSRARIAEAEASGIIATAGRAGDAMLKRKGISGTFIGIAAAAVAVAVYLKVSGKNKKIGRRKSKKRR